MLALPMITAAGFPQPAHQERVAPRACSSAGEPAVAGIPVVWMCP